MVRLAESQPVSRPAVSQHLKLLVEAGLVSVRAEGTRRFYEIRREGLTDLRQYVEGFWADTLDAFAAHAQKQKETNMLPPVIKTVYIPITSEQAFRVFTNELALWWPLDKHSCAAMAGETSQALDADLSTGGEIWETDHEGRRILWGTFTEFTPSSKLRINWHINRPADDATEISVEFTPNDDETEVTLTHSGWEVFGVQADAMREGYNNGWVHVFEERFKSACK